MKVGLRFGSFKSTVVFSHLSHDDWWCSFGEAVSMIPKISSRRNLVIWTGDFNASASSVVATNTGGAGVEEHRSRMHALGEMADYLGLHFESLEIVVFSG